MAFTISMERVFCKCTAMSRDMQVRVVICDRLAWLLRMKRPKKDVGGEALLNTPHSHHDDDLVTRTEEASSTQVTHVKCNEVCATKQWLNCNYYSSLNYEH